MTTNNYFTPKSQPETLTNIADYFDKHGDKWRSAYEDERERWNEYHPLRNRERFAVELIRQERKGAALDLGCGNGHLLVRMKHLGFKSVRGIDISDEMLSAARARLEASHLGSEVELIKADVEQLAMIRSQSIDVCTALGVVEYLDGDASLLSEAYRILRPGGALVIQMRNSRCAYTRIYRFIGQFIPRLRERIRYRQHRRSAFVLQATRLGFAVETELFSHFYALFPFNMIPYVQRLVRPLDNWASKWCERFAHYRGSEFLASMYIVKLRK